MDNKKPLFALIIILGIHITLLASLKFTAWPEMILWPYLIIKGWYPYEDIAIAHTPILIYVLTGFFKVFGVGVIQLMYFTWAILVASDFILFWVVKKMWNTKTAIVSTFVFVILSTYFDANGLWFDLALMPISLILFFFIKNKRYLLSGIIWTIMFFIKQTSVWFLAPVILEILWNKNNKRYHVSQFLTGIFITSGIVVLAFWRTGILNDFYRWAVNFGIFVLPKSQGQIQHPGIKELLISGYPYILLSLLLLEKRKQFVKIMAWSVFGAWGAYPRFEYFHLLPAAPFLSITAGILFASKFKAGWKKFALGVYVFGAIYLFAEYVLRNYNEGIRFYTQDVGRVVSYIKDSTEGGDDLFVLNWWDNIYALTDTMPATKPWVPQLQWYQELSGIQSEEVRDLKYTNPEFVVVYPYTSAGLSSYVPSDLYSYIISNYSVKDKIEGVEIWHHKNLK